MLDIIYFLIIIILIFTIARFTIPLLILLFVLLVASIRYIYTNLKSKLRKVRK